VREWYFAWAKKNIIPIPDELPDAPLVMHGTKFRGKKRKQQVVEVDEESNLIITVRFLINFSKLLKLMRNLTVIIRFV